MKTDTREKMAALLQRRASVTPNEAAVALGISPRNARRLLAQMHLHREVSREGEYTGNPPVFSYRYRAVTVKA
jgi:predicted ArsR family transcriptional regulator